MADTSEPQESLPASAMRIPMFRAIWSANVVSNLGTMIQSVGASWLMLSLDAPPQLIALVQASTSLPIMLFALAAGAIADNFDRRRVMLSAQIFMLVTSTLLTALAWAGWLTPWTLLVFTFLVGCGTAFNGPAWQASVGDIVPRPLLPGAVAFNGMGYNIARSAGPALGGAIVAAAGAAAAFFVNALSYVALIAVLLRWRPQHSAPRLPSEPLASAMAAGVRYVAMSPGVRTILLRATLFGLGASAVPALTPLVSRDLLAGGAIMLGLLLGGFGFGAIIGAFVGGRLRERLAPEPVLRCALAALIAGTLIVAASKLWPLTLVGMMIAGGGWVLALSTLSVSVQLSTPRWVVGRAIALFQVSAFGGMAIGSWLYGQAAAGFDTRAALVAAAAVQGASLLVGLALPLPKFAGLNLDPRGWEAPETALAVEARSGPVVVTIEYRIAEADVDRFLQAMAERRRIRRRDGARHWTLLRDVMDPEAWTERYQVATWLDYVRHNQRRTHADTEIFRRTFAMHQAGEPPVIRRQIEWPARASSAGKDDLPATIADPLADISGPG